MTTTRAQERVNKAVQRQQTDRTKLHDALTHKSALAFIKGVAPGMDPRAVALVAYATVRSRPDLMACRPESIVRAVAEAAKLRLTVDGALGHSYLVPFNDRRLGKLATMMIGYRGYIHLAYQSDKVARIHPSAIFENDEFVYAEGAELTFHHQRPQLGKDRGEMIGAYTLAHLTAGGPPLVCVMDRAEIEARRAQSASFKHKPKDSPWTTHPEAMWMKTTIRELAKRLPVPELQAAALRDEARDDGRHAPPSVIDITDATEIEDAEPNGDDGRTGSDSIPEACPKCGRVDLRADGTCWDCEPDQEGENSPRE